MLTKVKIVHIIYCIVTIQKKGRVCLEDFKDFIEISRLMERTIHKYIQVEKMKRYYGSDILLSRSEIHTIAAVGDYPNINITALAKFLGITKGASSQMIYRLVDKGLIIKQISPNSDTEVCLTLTEKGKVAYAKHQEYHKDADDKVFKILTDMPKEVIDNIKFLLEEFDKDLDKRISDQID